METQGIVIFATGRDASLLVWCADGAALVYVPDRRRAGDTHAALAVGDLVDLRIEAQGARRIGTALRYRGTGAGWVRRALARAWRDRPVPVMSPDPRLAQCVTVPAGLGRAGTRAADGRGPGMGRGTGTH